MAYRPSWQGHLKLSLVTCPVALYTAINSGGDVHFNLINPKTNNRIKMITTDPDTGPIERTELVKGYEVSKGEYILLSAEEIASVKLESTKTIDIERFVAGDEIDRLYWDNPYFMEPRGKGILAYTIRTDAEVRKPDEIFAGINDKAADPEMISIAEKIIEQKEGPFDPGQFVDRYEEALKALIDDKKKGHKPAKVAEPEATNVVDLMSALRASLGSKGKTPASAEPKSKAAKPTAKKARKAG
jgi:DNA end-binding protein Ku